MACTLKHKNLERYLAFYFESAAKITAEKEKSPICAHTRLVTPKKQEEK